MSIPLPDDADSLGEDSDAEISSSSREEMLQWLEQLRRSDRSLYNQMALEVWSIAQTMDGLIPGFWNRFMENRQQALQEFLAQRQAQQADAAPDDFPHPDQEEGGMMESEDG